MVRRGCDRWRGPFESDRGVLIPPILEVYILWHPDDTDGPRIARGVFDHFHGTAFAGLIGGAVEVYPRSTGWETPDGPPRPLPFMEPLPNGLTKPAVSVVVPILGTRLARATEEHSGWHDYLESLVDAAAADPTVGVFGLRIDNAATAAGTVLGNLFSPTQALAAAGVSNPAILARDLAHSIAGLIGDPTGDRLRVFISHTKRYSPDEEPDAVLELVRLIRDVIGSTHLSAFFDDADLQPGTDWEEELTVAAATSGLLVVRTDLYASRDWCQREVLTAKRADMPIVVLQALHHGEERGSFLMDHVPTVPLRSATEEEARMSIEAALNRLVDEALKRALWNQQRTRLATYGFDWLPANAPEPVTLIDWLASADKLPSPPGRLFVLHPDPPLGNAENTAINNLLSIAGISGLEILTPRTFASRGGQVKP
jgi:hypothetical protein